MRLPADNPIRRPEDDALGRAKIAESFADQVLALDASEGAVVGVLAAWGHGKTSFVNLARLRIAEAGVLVLDFNPWMFSGAEQLVESFFVELSSQLKLKPELGKVAQCLEDYGESFSGLGWLPVVGPWIERGRGSAGVLAKLLQRRKEGITERRAKLAARLTELKQPIVVVVDDIDRLSTSEIRDVFKLVRLTASLPNIIYIVAFDRARVEDALAEQRLPGRDYLEKILQIAIDLPAVPEQVLSRQILAAVDQVIADVAEPGPFDQDAWPDLFMEVIRPLVRNMRDVRRYATNVHGTVKALAGEIALADVLALEAVRVFLPDVFAELHAAVEGLTTTSGLSLGAREPARLKMAIERLIAAAGEHEAVVRAMVARLFPAGARHVGGMSYGESFTSQWLREHRVAHEAILRLYLERVAGDSLQAFRDASRAWALMPDRSALDAYLRSLEPQRLEDVIASLENYEELITPEHIVPGTIVLLNMLPDLPERARGMFSLDARLVVSRVTYRLVRALSDPEAIAAAVREILPSVTTLSSKLELISDVGYLEGAGHRLVAEAVAAEIERAWRAEVRAASADDLARESDLLRVLLRAQLDVGCDEPRLAVPDVPALTLAILRAARSEVLGRTIGNRAVRRESRLNWKVLVTIYGDDETVRARFNALKSSGDEGDPELIALVESYLGGWRPEN
ncbi:MAG: P-loop NTPase fold protein [Solirubrobacteraceae bacterium]